MKMPARKKNKKPIIIIALVSLALLAIAAFSGWYFFLRQAQINPQDGTINYGPPTEQEKKVGDEQKQIIEQQETAQNTGQTLTVTIARAFQDPSGFNIRTVVGGTKAGECQLELTKDGQPAITKTYPVVFQGTSSSCQTAPIPTNEFATSGEWNIKVTVTYDGRQSQSAQSSITITK